MGARAAQFIGSASCLLAHPWPLSGGVQRHAQRLFASDCRGPGSVPPHNCHLFVCGPRPGSNDGTDMRFSQLANEAMQEAAEAHAERGQDPSSITWTFGLSMCECPPECEPGDLFLFPHYLHLRPTAAASELHSSSLSGISGPLLAAIAALEPQQGAERQPGEAPRWASTSSDCALSGSIGVEQDSPTERSLVEVISSVRHRSHVFIWSQTQVGGSDGHGPGGLQQALLLELSANAALKPSDVAVMQCSPPLTGAHPPDGSAASGSFVPGVGAAVFTAQSRAYATWGAGIGEWFEYHDGSDTQTEDGPPSPSSLSSLLASFLVSTHDSGAGPYTMNALAYVIAGGAAWRGRLGLGQDEALAVYNHFTAAAAASVSR
eukprot:COSAG02_NODE_14194_length_1298_cov_88.661384_1_plen_376_part_00